MKDLDPKYHLSILHDKYSELPPDVKRKLKGMTYKELSKAREVSDFRKEVNKFIQRFGHLSDSNMDFSAMHWSEDPDLMLKMIIDYKKPEIDGDRVDIDALAKGAKGRFLKFFYNRAVGYREYKERVSFNYTYGYGLFRNYFLHLAEIFKKKGFIKKEDDIFYLTLDEITDMVESGEIPKEYKKSIKQRKEEMSKYKDVILPDLIYGDEPPQLMKSMRFKKRKGVAASKGYYTGIIKVVRGIRDFKKIKAGDILVVPYTDVSWTPLFSKAKAVISESGGILSHSAIVAREYNIPAVVSVAGATELKDNTKVAVDGYNGEILIIES